jgi:hypothetical protein
VRRRRGEKTLDLFRPMLAVAVENDDVSEIALEPVAQASLDRFAFAAVLRMDDHLRARLSRGFRGRVGRAVVDHQHVIKLLQRSPDNVRDMFFFEVSRNDGGDRRPIDRGVIPGHRHFV